MSIELFRNPEKEAVKQISIFADNKVGRLNDLVMALSGKELSIMAMTTVDTTDSSIIRIIVDYWEQARDMLERRNLAYSISEVIVAELKTPADLQTITSSLVQAEINIHYTYPMLVTPNDGYGLVIRLEDNDLANSVLNQNGIKTLIHRDIAR